MNNLIDRIEKQDVEMFKFKTTILYTLSQSGSKRNAFFRTFYESK